MLHPCKVLYSRVSVDFSRFKLKPANLSHANDIRDLINLTYRGALGWTKETHIIQGDRTHSNEIEFALTHPEGAFFVIYQDQSLVSCIYVAKEKYNAYIGYFSVHPRLQGKGVGKHVLQQAEAFAGSKLGACKYVMYVVSQRPELIAFYERRGYARTGRVEAYPLHLGIGVPRVDGLTIEYLEKSV